jgi:simple sugar transport system ATP-binding protein
MISSASARAAAEPRLRLRGIRKVYPGVVANDGIDLAVMPGEIHAVLGENGAGKSTLMKVICGVTPPTDGEMLWEGEPALPADPSHARALGIGMVFQHFSLFETLTVVENVALTLTGASDLAALAREISAVSTRYGLVVDPRRLVHALSVGERQRVEIVRCLMQKPRLLILDEPTSVLTPQAVRELFATLRALAADGCSILYISHKLDEIKELCHVATVLRAGRVTGTCIPSEETPQSMARMMIGADLPVPRHGAPAAKGEIRLRVAGLSHASPDPFGVDLKDVHLDVHSGEIVGIAGISGNGQKELLWAVSGEEPLAEKYPIQILGIEAGRMRAGRRRRLGFAFVPEDRLGRGALARMTLAENALLTAHRRGMVRRGLIDLGAVVAFARECIDRFSVACSGPQARADTLSGGNLQKFIVGREVLQQPKVLVVAQPTWGVDVGAAAFIRQALIDLRTAGAAILVISEELDELFEICDRIAVIANGKLSPAKRTVETSIEEIGVWMSGMWPGAEAAAGISGVA